MERTQKKNYHYIRYFATKLWSYFLSLIDMGFVVFLYVYAIVIFRKVTF